MPKITFQANAGILDAIPHPRPATKFVPKWYKDMKLENICPHQVSEKEFVDNEVPTVKQCIPVRDMITAGYIIPAWTDIKIKTDKKGIMHNVMPPLNAEAFNIGISWHGIEQVKDTPLVDLSDGDKLLKLLSPWLIKTPLGYSTLFISPFYTNSDIFILPAIVDTDAHDVEINFPSVLTKRDVHLKQGQPLIQAIPFKRESWTHSVCVTDEKKSEAAHFRFASRLSSHYTRVLHKKKTYR